MTNFDELDETAQMTALGLPTAFGRTKNNKKLSENIQKKIYEHKTNVDEYISLILEATDLIISDEEDMESTNLNIQENEEIREGKESSDDISHEENLEVKEEIPNNVSEAGVLEVEEKISDNVSKEEILEVEEKTSDNVSKDEFLEGKEQISDNVSKEEISDTISNNLDLIDSSSKIKRKRKTKRKKNRDSIVQVSEECSIKKTLFKYWYKRFSLFSRFDDGIQLDEEGWFSVTPEKIAKHAAERMSCDLIIDGFCGIGGNSIQFGFTCNKVIAIDIDPKKIEMAKNNAKIYGVENKIEFICGNFLDLIPYLKADMIFLSPPWGGPDYNKNHEYDIENKLIPVSASILINKCRQITENIAIYLPRNSNQNQLVRIAGIGKKVELEENYLDTKLVALTAYYGDLIKE